MLKQVTLDDSRAVGSATVYQFKVEGRDGLAVALPIGEALVVEVAAPVHSQRRCVDPAAT